MIFFLNERETAGNLDFFFPILNVQKLIFQQM